MGPEETTEKLRTYCAYQERCVADVQQKMNKLTTPDEWREDIINSLKEEGYLNEGRYAGAFARGHFYQKKWGNNKIKEALQIKGLHRRDIDAGLAELPTTEYAAQLEALINQKLKQIKDKDPYIINNKAARFAIGKGYEPELVWAVLKNKKG